MEATPVAHGGFSMDDENDLAALDEALAWEDEVSARGEAAGEASAVMAQATESMRRLRDEIAEGR
jgi:hypothetical protein